MLEKEKYFQTLMFANFACLSADIFFNERYKNQYDPVFLLGIIYAGLYSYKLENRMRTLNIGYI